VSDSNSDCGRGVARNGGQPIYVVDLHSKKGLAIASPRAFRSFAAFEFATMQWRPQVAVEAYFDARKLRVRQAVVSIRIVDMLVIFVCMRNSLARCT